MQFRMEPRMAPDLHQFRQPTTIGVHDFIDTGAEVVLSPIPARPFAVFTATMLSEISPGDSTRPPNVHFLVFVGLHIRDGDRPSFHQYLESAEDEGSES